MILRKPYALLIKNFRLIHLFLTAIVGYLFYRNTFILNLFNNYIASPTTLKGYDSSRELFPILIYLGMILVIAISFMILGLMAFKKKPYLYYLYTTILYVVLFFLLITAEGSVNTLETALIDVRSARAIRDFIMIAMIFQGINVAISLVRGLGFDIKKFDFGENIEELQIEEEDYEEFELAVDFDYNNYVVRFRRFVRHLRYFYLEHRIMSNILISFTVIVVVVTQLLNIFVFNTVYSEKQIVRTNDYQIKVIDSYVTTNDYRNNKFLTDTKAVVVKVDVKSLRDITLDNNSIFLSINGKRYRALNIYQNELSDLGYVYNEEKLTEEFKSYLLTYELPNNINTNNVNIVFTSYALKNTELLASYKKVKLNIENLDKELVTKEYKLTELADLADSVLKLGTLKIDEIKTSDYVTLSYNYCANKNSCYDSKETLRPNLNSYEKIILSIKTSSNLPLKFDDFLKKYGEITYKQGDVLKLNNAFGVIVPTKAKATGYNYYEITKNASNISKITFKIRNNVYTYVLE